MGYENIEEDLKRIAQALERMANVLDAKFCGEKGLPEEKGSETKPTKGSLPHMSTPTHKEEKKDAKQWNQGRMIFDEDTEKYNRWEKEHSLYFN